MEGEGSVFEERYLKFVDSYVRLYFDYWFLLIVIYFYINNKIVGIIELLYFYIYL